MPPEVLAGVPLALDLVAHAPDDDHLLQEVEALNGRVGAVLLGDGFGAAEGPVAGDQQLGAAVLNAVAQRIGAEPAEDDAVNGADAGAGQHGDGQFGDHGQVDLHAVALLDALGLQDVGELADLLVHLLVGERAALRGLVALPLDGDLVAPGLQVTVQAVVGDVELPALEILEVDGALADIEVVILDLVPFLEPLHVLARNVGPEAVRILDRPLPDLVVSLPAADVGHLLDLFRYRVDIFQLYFVRFCHVSSYLPKLFAFVILSGTFYDFSTQSL